MTVETDSQNTENPSKKGGKKSASARGRGRPRKEKAAEAPLKRGRGRPRKEQPAEAPVKRGRGRPRKSETLARIAAAAAESVDAPEAMRRMTELGRHVMGVFEALFPSHRGGPAMQSEDILTARDVAKLVRTREADVLTAISRGELRATRIGDGYRITRHNVEAWLHGR